VLPHHRIVGRTFARQDRCLRMSKDYEVPLQTSENMLRIAMANLMQH